jgi:DNA-binding NarL/FixJ family response regulator
VGVILGGVAGEERVRRSSPWLVFVPMNTYALVRAPGPSMPTQTRITIVLAHFDDLLTGGLRELIASDPSLTIVAADVEHERIPVVLRAHRPDVAILDLGAVAKLVEVRELSAHHPGTSLVLLSNDPSTEDCAQLLAFGASACLGRDTQSRDMLSAIHLGSRGLQVTPRVASKRSGRPIAGGHLLTQREAEVLPLLREGHSNAQIALALHVGVETVRSHARSIYRKLGVSSRRDLASLGAPAPERQATSAAKPARRRASMPVTRLRRGHGSRHS